MGPYAPKPSAKWMNAQRLIKWIESNNVMQIIFGASTHQHLLSRSSELLRFMAREQVLSEAHITMMWNTILVCLFFFFFYIITIFTYLFQAFT